MRNLSLALVLMTVFGVGPAWALDAKGNARIDAAINRLNQMGPERPKEVHVPKMKNTMLVIFVVGDSDSSGCPKGFLNSPLDSGAVGFMCSGPSMGNFTYVVPQRAGEVNLEGGDFKFHWPKPEAKVVTSPQPTINVPAFKAPVLLSVLVEGSQFTICPQGFLMSPLVNSQGQPIPGYLCSGPSKGGFTLQVPQGATSTKVQGGTFVFEWPSK